MNNEKYRGKMKVLFAYWIFSCFNWCNKNANYFFIICL